MDNYSYFEAKVSEKSRLELGLLDLYPDIERASQAIVYTLKTGGLILACGNGGSAADADHFVGELLGRFLESSRPALPAVYLNGSSAATSAIRNDFGPYEEFARQVEAFSRTGNCLLVCFSTSGKSPNIIRALESAKSLNVPSLLLTGHDGGTAMPLATWSVTMKSQNTARIQESHQFILHWIAEEIDKAFTQ
jgi:D-sedoheptulose 7-phosphate isomerase